MRPDVKLGHNSYILTKDGTETTGPLGFPEDSTPVGSDCKAGKQIHSASTIQGDSQRLRQTRTFTSHFNKTSCVLVSCSRTSFSSIWCSKGWRCNSWEIHHATSTLAQIQQWSSCTLAEMWSQSWDSDFGRCSKNKCNSHVRSAHVFRETNPFQLEQQFAFLGLEIASSRVKTDQSFNRQTFRLDPKRKRNAWVSKTRLYVKQLNGNRSW